MSNPATTTSQYFASLYTAFLSLVYTPKAPVIAQPRKCILLGLKKSVVDDAIEKIPDPAFELIGCLSIEEMKAVLEKNQIAHVFIGAGLDIDIRINAARTVLETSLVTQVHLKNHSAGPQGYVPFIKTILAGVKAQGEL